MEELLSDALRRCRTAIPSAADIARTVIACADRLAKECEEMRRKSDDRWTDQSVGVSVVFSRNGQHVSFEWDWKQGLKQGLMNDDAAPTEIPVLQMNRECYERLRDRYRHHRGDPAREKSRLVVMLLKYHALQLGDHGQHAALPPEAMNALREGEPFIIFHFYRALSYASCEQILVARPSALQIHLMQGLSAFVRFSKEIVIGDH